MESSDKTDKSAHPDYGVRGVNVERIAAVRQHAGSEVLDVGCGSGAYVLALADSHRIRGLDYQHFESWKQRPELFGISDAQALDLPDNSVDTILSFETLEHLPSPAKALQEYFRVCRRNLILTVPNCALTPGMRGSGLIYNHWIDRTHVNFWDLESLSAEIAKTGFTIEERKYINHINLGPLAAESLGLKGFAAKVVSAIVRRLQRQRYPMTCLVVAAKPDSAGPSVSSK